MGITWENKVSGGRHFYKCETTKLSHGTSNRTPHCMVRPGKEIMKIVTTGRSNHSMLCSVSLSARTDAGIPTSNA